MMNLTFTAKEAKDGFGRLVDLARSSPVTVNQHSRPVIMVIGDEEFGRLRSATQRPSISPKPRAR